jgi:methylthioribose-1-phosphate isomerase
MTVETLRWVGELPGHVEMIEQTRLPLAHEQLAVRDVDAMVDAIYRLAVRGAPAIGVAAGYGVVLGVQHHAAEDREALRARVDRVAEQLAAARPTAVNLFWALRRMRERAHGAAVGGEALVPALLAEARAIHAEDAAQCRAMGRLGAELLADGATVLTHCNAGALATGGIGTALAPVYVAAEQGKTVHVYADETRPLLQGARLTAWELQQAGIDVTLIADGAAASVLASGRVDLVFVGSDRIAANGDVCNKIGTYGVALAAKAHGVPFHVVAPLSTFDPELASGAEIPIEDRPAEEVAAGFGPRTTPPGVAVHNPAFDVTPAEFVTSIVTEVGRIERPDSARVQEALRRGGRLDEPRS